MNRAEYGQAANVRVGQFWVASMKPTARYFPPRAGCPAPLFHVRCADDYSFHEASFIFIGRIGKTLDVGSENSVDLFVVATPASQLHLGLDAIVHFAG